MSERRDPGLDEPMPDQHLERIDTEQLLAAWFQDEAPKQEPPVLLPAVLSKTAMTRRRPKWFTRDWWLSVLGLVDRRPPPTMVSIGFIALLTALTLLAAFALLPASEDETVEEPPPGTIVVAADGSGDYLTVAEGVAAAEDGNTILIRPGQYTEAVDTTKELTFRGDGADRSEVFIRAADIATPVLRIDGAPVTIENLTIEIAPPTDTLWEGTVYLPFGIEVVGGPANVISIETVAYPPAGCALALDLDSDFAATGNIAGPRSTISNSRFTGGGGGICTGSVGQLLVEGSTFEDLAVAMRVAGEDVQVTGSTFLRNEQAVISAFEDDIFLKVAVDDNDFSDNGIGVRADGGEVAVTDNRFTGGDGGVRYVGTWGRIADNTLSDVDGLGISLTDSDPLVERNVVSGGETGVSIRRGDPWLMGNEFERMSVSAVQVYSGSTPKIVGNAFCDNATDLDVPQDVESTIEGNPICATAETRTWAVVQDGSGDFTTIREAVDAAVDGDTILVHPGTYDEQTVLGKDVTIRGTGERADTVIEISAPFPNPEEWATMDRLVYTDPPFAFWIVESDAVIENLTLRGTSSTVIVRGGAPTLQGLHLAELGYIFSPPGQDLMPFTGLSFEGGSRASLRDNLIEATDVEVFEGSKVEIVGNTFTGGALTVLDPGTDASVRGNSFSGSNKWSIAVWNGAKPRIADNDIAGGSSGIDVHAIANPVINANQMSDEWGNIDFLTDAEAGILPDVITDPTIEGNRIEGATTAGIWVRPYADATVVTNALTDNQLGIWLERSGEVRLEANGVSGGSYGIQLSNTDTPVVGNDVTGADSRGLAIMGTSAPRLTDNAACDSAVDLWVAPDAEPKVDESNEICVTEASAGR